jgi:hypothetical protein
MNWLNETRLETSGVAFVFGVQYVISIKAVSWILRMRVRHKKLRVKSKTKQIIPTIIPVT